MEPNNTPINVLAVDDDDMNLFILSKNLRTGGFTSIEAEDGIKAWKLLMEHPENVHFLLLDRMMPGMDGIEVTKKMREHSKLRFTPIIIQSGKVGADVLEEAYQAGADHYLVKPFSDEQMLWMSNSVKHTVLRYLNLETLLQNPPRIENEATIKLPSEAEKISVALAHDAADPMAVAIALSEILLNAIEHGNLGIGSESKAEFIKNNTWHAEVNKLLSNPELQVRSVKITVQQNGGERVVTIEDSGQGFEWQRHLKFDYSAVTKLCGRGINQASRNLKKLEYIGNGNKVCCSFDLKQ